MNLKEFLLDSLFPPRCLTCATALGGEAKAHAICDACFRAIGVNETLFCIVCRARLADNVRICHANTPLRLAAVGNYGDERLRTLITRLKYRRHTLAMNALDLFIERYLGALHNDFRGYEIVAIPLHKQRERERGFNQSLLIAQELAKQLTLPSITNGLIKIKKTLPQAKTKNREQRTHNLADCFAVPDPTVINGKKILLIDDVCTSGATLIEAANTLKKAGARNIVGFVMAKTG